MNAAALVATYSPPRARESTIGEIPTLPRKSPMKHLPLILIALLLLSIATSLSTPGASAARPAPRPVQVLPPGAPRVLSISSIGVQASVEAVALKKPADMKAPYKWGDVAWYSRGPRPGDTGRAQIYGHLDSLCCPAVFWKLKDLTAGDRVSVQYGNGQSVTFKVRWNRVYPDGALPKRFMYARTTERGLLLITCTGVFHRDGTGYDHRQVVYATLTSLAGGAAPPSLSTPLGVSVNRQGDVFVADSTNNRISSFDPQRRALHRWGSRGDSPGQFQGLSGIAVGPEGTVYVADEGNQRIGVFSSSGQLRAEWGPTGSVKVNVTDPAGVAVDTHGNVYVADSSANQIVKLSPTGEVLATWGRSGHGPGEFWYPDAVAVAPDGTIYVADSANGRIQKLSSDGTFLKMWKVKGAHQAILSPEGVAADAFGHVYVVSPRDNSVRRYSTSGKLTAHWGTTGSGFGQLRKPYGVAADSHGNVYVADSENSRVQEFSSSGKPIRLWW